MGEDNLRAGYMPLTNAVTFLQISLGPKTFCAFYEKNQNYLYHLRNIKYDNSEI